MICLALSLGILFAGAFLCLATARQTALARVAGPAVTVAGCLCGLVPAALALAGAPPPALNLPWSRPSRPSA